MEILTSQPTALFDGLIDNSVSSSWGKDEWEKFLSYVLLNSQQSSVETRSFM